MATLANTYNLLDDYDSGSNPLTVNGPGGGGTGQVLYTFTAPTIAAAMQMAYVFSSTTQRPVRLAPQNTPGPYTLVVGVGPGVGLTQIPSGIGY